MYFIEFQCLQHRLGIYLQSQANVNNNIFQVGLQKYMISAARYRQP